MLDQQRLQQEFFNRHVLEVARDLLGKILVYNEYRGVIIETEAYRDKDDPASHAFNGYTKRSSTMFGPPGFSYVYLIYGLYNCFNIVAEPAGTAAAVLVRSLNLIAPSSIMLNGPGILCKYMGITRELNGVDLNTNEALYIQNSSVQVSNIKLTSRIGVSRNKEAQWRFVLV